MFGRKKFTAVPDFASDNSNMTARRLATARGRPLRVLATALALTITTGVHAVILLGDGRPATNTTAPTGTLLGSGWQYQGAFGDYLGTPIAPQFFMTAQHVAGASATIVYGGTTYSLLQRYDDPFTDLTIWQIAGSFPTFAPLYTSGNETGEPLVVIGRGTQRGAAIFRNDANNVSTLRGWAWVNDDHVQRWGENVVAQIVSGGPANQFVYATFDNNGTVNEAHLSSGDSGGAVFLNDAGTWKLAGISYAVDGPFYPNPAEAGGFNAALFDARNFFSKEGSQFVQITGPDPVPTGFYASRISSKLGWISKVIDPMGDANGNGRSNIFDYAFDLNAPAPAGPGAPTVTKEGATLVIVYRRLVGPNAPLSQLQSSGNLTAWNPVTNATETIATRSDVQTITARVPITGDQMFLRVRVVLP